MAGKISSNKITVSTSAQYGVQGDRDWVEMTNTDAAVTVYGRYDAVASSSNWDFIIPAGTAKTWDKGLSNNVSLATDSGTAVLTIEQS